MPSQFSGTGSCDSSWMFASLKSAGLDDLHFSEKRTVLLSWGGNVSAYVVVGVESWADTLLHTDCYWTQQCGRSTEYSYSLSVQKNKCTERNRAKWKDLKSTSKLFLSFKNPSKVSPNSTFFCQSNNVNLVTFGYYENNQLNLFKNWWWKLDADIKQPTGYELNEVSQLEKCLKFQQFLRELF